jgi:ribulose kinase
VGVDFGTLSGRAVVVRLDDGAELAKAAVKAAVMCEDVARSVHIARQLGDPLPIDPTDIDALYTRYQNA